MDYYLSPLHCWTHNLLNDLSNFVNAVLWTLVNKIFGDFKLELYISIDNFCSISLSDDHIFLGTVTRNWDVILICNIVFVYWWPVYFITLYWPWFLNIVLVEESCLFSCHVKYAWCLTYTALVLQDRDRKLRIFSGNEHPFHDRPLEPFVMPPRQVREMRPRARRAMIRAQKKEQANRAKEEEDAKNATAEITA